MGVDRRDYIVVGVDLVERPDKYYNGDIEDFCEQYYFKYKIGDITFIDDFYNGNYFIVGEVLQVSKDYDDGLDYSLLGKEEQIEIAKIRVKAFIKEYFNIDSSPYVIIKTQWS
ncbi:hypothetical protein [Bacillus phage PK-3]|nr:hypothetical protein [Bacillus phage PK-3]